MPVSSLLFSLFVASLREASLLSSYLISSVSLTKWVVNYIPLRKVSSLNPISA